MKGGQAVDVVLSCLPERVPRVQRRGRLLEADGPVVWCAMGRARDRPRNGCTGAIAAGESCAGPAQRANQSHLGAPHPSLRTHLSLQFAVRFLRLVAYRRSLRPPSRRGGGSLRRAAATEDQAGGLHGRRAPRSRGPLRARGILSGPGRRSALAHERAGARATCRCHRRALRGSHGLARWTHPGSLSPCPRRRRAAGGGARHPSLEGAASRFADPCALDPASTKLPGAARPDRQGRCDGPRPESPSWPPTSAPARLAGARRARRRTRTASCSTPRRWTSSRR